MSSNLEDAKVVVAGGAGAVGEGIVRALLKRRARVVVTSRSEDKLRELQANCHDISTGELIPLVGDLSDEASARDLQNRLYGIFRDLDLAVASLGGWTQGNPLTSVDMLTWNRVLQDNLTSHFLAVKILVPLLHPKTGRYVHINGFSAEQPYPQGGPVAMASAAQKSMMLTLAEELKPTGIRVFELILGPIKTRQRARTGNTRPDWYTSEEVGEHVVTLVTGSSKEVVHRLLGKH
jgi:NAD(P)-dependent dehydrogenase (short-subunit alcohol dehydrogenase family)